MRAPCSTRLILSSPSTIVSGNESEAGSDDDWDAISHLDCWFECLTLKSKCGDGSSLVMILKDPCMGPVFSTFVYEEESENDSKMDAIQAFAREGEVDNLIKCIDSGVSVDAKDSEGRTPLHWAVDRGHLNMAEMLVSRNAVMQSTMRAKPHCIMLLAVCEREGIAKYLVKKNADTNVKDNDGNSPSDLCESNWPWRQRAKDRSRGTD
ncbi:hypothetical protein M0R45_016500 [Rubus argutus]|uniref:Uncharacterized protein n=1 Tax=Rubus argutus TaxID=59490 RepID=A0AAW1XSQ6_RUBAR